MPTALPPSGSLAQSSSSSLLSPSLLSSKASTSASSSNLAASLSAVARPSQTRATIDQLVAGTLIKDIKIRAADKGKSAVVYVLITMHSHPYYINLPKPLAARFEAKQVEVALLKVVQWERLAMAARMRFDLGRLVADAEWIECDDSTTCRSVVT